MENTLKYLLVEDDDFDQLSVDAEAAKFPFLKKIGVCSNPLAAMELIELYRPDVLFLDVEMPGMTGMEFLRLLRGRPMLAVFITSHPEYAVEGYELEAFDYLVKPLTAERFARCALRLRDFTELRSKAMAFEKEQASDVFVIKQGYDKYKVNLSEIMYLEAMKDYTRIQLKDKQYLVLTTLTELLERLPPERFVRIHRSYALQLNKVSAVKGTKVLLGGFELPVGRLYRDVLKGILTLVVCFVCFRGFSQRTPRLDTISGYAAKMAAWTAYCDSLRLNASANALRLQQAGMQGMRLARGDDYDHQARFASTTGLGYYYQTRFDSAQYYFYRSLNSALTGHLTSQIVRACVTLIPVNFQLQQPDKMDSCKTLLESIVDTSHERRLLEDGYTALGGYYQDKSYYSTAQDYFIRSIELREKEVDTTADMKRKFDFAIQCDMLSKLYLNTQMVDKSLAALRKGQRFASVSPNVANRLMSSFVEAFSTSGRIDSALYYDRELDANVSNPLAFPSEVVSSDLNIAIYYLDRQQYEEARPWVDKADSVSAKVGSPILNFQVQMTRARYFLGLREYQRAIALLDQSLPVARQLNKELYASQLKYMAQAQKGKGDDVAAFGFFEQYVNVTDSLNSEKLSRTFADLETRYRSYEQQVQLAQLGKENRLRELQLGNASRERLILVVGLVALGIISLLLYFFYRNKARLNRLLNERNDQLDQVNQELALANDTKASLFGIIGHDLRGPVGKIIRMLQLQKEQPQLFTPETRATHEERLQKATENVLETMEDLLIWSKSQMQHFHPECRMVCFADVFNKVIVTMQDQLEEKGVTIENRVPPGITRESDEHFLSVILRNLLQNAVRHGAGERIVIDGTASEITITNPVTATEATILNQRIGDRRIDSGASGLGLQLAADLAGRIGARFFFRGENGVLTAVLVWGRPAVAVA
ncbi:MAG TPA: LytTR family transcriptional regulator DNA-binding domain-containing protein [Puia sp.]|nr:LytTR family transcriptional regulator DNA-binding domain-containing protein [Puia sp.]